MTFHDFIPILIALIGSGGVIGAIVAFYKLKPETGQLMVTTAQGVVIIQTGVIESLREEIGVMRTGMKELKRELAEAITRARECAELTAELKQRIRDLESKNIGHVSRNRPQINQEELENRDG